MDLRNQVIWVTGASQGIGRAVAHAFAEAKAEVILTSRDEAMLRAMAHEFREKGHKTAVLPADISDPKGMDRIGDQIQSQFGRLDVLVNSAGVLTQRKLMHEVTAEEWNQTMAVNLLGAFLCQRVALRLMLTDHKGVIVHLTSGVGKNPSARWGAYGVSKAGVEMLVRASAEEYRDTGIRFHAFNPGATRTQMRARAFPDEDPKILKSPENAARFLQALIQGELDLPSGSSVDYSAGQ